jgi:predicted Zn finger-like uncharacterized protein
MFIVCPNCATSYQVTPEKLGETGRSVRCVNCHQVWFEPPRQPAGPPAVAVGPEGIDPATIRPPLNDVVDIGDAQAGLGDRDAAGEAFPHDDIAAEADAAYAAPESTPEIVPPADPVDGRHIDAPTNIERSAARRAGKPARARRRLTLSRHALPASICALALILVCLIAARPQVVRLLPQTASLYARIGLPVNLRGLAFENIKTAREVQDGVPMLVVEGEIVGTTGRHTEVPRLRFAVVDGAGKEIYAWSARPPRTLLPPGETLPFRSRLASPPAEASSVSVRFFNRRDVQAGFM